MFGLFQNKKEPLSDSLRTFTERVTILEARVSSLEYSNDVLRDKVLRKIQSVRVAEEEPTVKLKAGQRVKNGS